MLTDKESYNLGDKAAAVNTNSMSYAMFMSIPVLLMGGITYDLIGRRATTAGFFFIGAATTICFPYGKDLSWKIIYFDIFRIIY